MSKSDPSVCNDQAGRSPPAKTNRSGNRRVDPPHSTGGGPAAEASPRIPTAPRAVPEVLPDSDLIKLQAEQLGDHLRQRQEELDHREAELNSLAARLESDARSARLWLNEREAELASRSDELAGQQARLAGQQQMVAQERRAAEARVEQLRQQVLDQRRRHEEAQAEPMRHQSAARGLDPADREAALRPATEFFQARQRQFDAAESGIALAQADIQRVREELLAERRAFEEEVVAARRQLADQRRQALTELEEQRRAVQRRGEHVDRCRAALGQVHAELQRVQRETLEVRLATEELWTQLSGAAPPAALTRGLGRIRARLAEHHRQAEAELAERKAELQGLHLELTEQHANVSRRKRRLEEWIARQREEIDQQGSRLLNREQQLRVQEARLRETSQEWRSERLEYQQEIRRLRAALAAREETGIAAACTF